MDLLLDQQWSSTAASTSNIPAIQKLLQVDFVQLSFAYPFLGHGLLSIAYSHLSQLSSQMSQRPQLIADSSWHLGVALPQYSRFLGHITQENCHVLFAFANFMILHTFMNACEDFEGLLSRASGTSYRERLVPSLIKVAIRVTGNIRSIFFVFHRYQHWIMTGTASAIAQRHTPPILSGPQMSWASYEDRCLSELGQLWQTDPSIDQSSLYILSEALQYLRGSFKLVTQLTVLPNRDTAPAHADLGEIHKQLLAGKLDDLPSAFTWHISVSTGYLDMLGRQNPFAIMLLAHYAILLDRACSWAWWIRRMPSQLVATALLALGNERRSWIEWPISVVGLGIFDE